MKKIFTILSIFIILYGCGTDEKVKKKKVIKKVEKTPEQILQEKQEKAKIDFKEGIEAYSKGNFQKAINKLESSYKIITDNFEIPYTLSKIYLKQGAYSKAENFFIKARGLKNNHNELNLLFGNMLYNLKRYVEAKELFEDSFAKDPKFAEATITLLAIYKELIKTEKDKDKKLKMVKKAESFAQKGLKEIPGSAHIYNNLSEIYYIIGNKPLSFYTLSIAEKNAPKSSIILNNIGWYYEKENNHYRAKVYYKKALKESPLYLPALKNIVRLKMDSLDYKGSLPIFEKILKQDPENLNAKYGIALCYLGEFKYQKGIEIFKQLYDKTSDDKYALIIGDIYYKNLASDDKYIEKPKERKIFLTEAKKWYSIYKDKHPELKADSDILASLSDITMQLKATNNAQKVKTVENKKAVDKKKLEELKKRMEEDAKEDEEKEGEGEKDDSKENNSDEKSLDKKNKSIKIKKDQS